MTEPAAGRLSIDADLALSVDGVHAALTGDGGDLTLRTDDPAGLTSALRRSGAVGAIRRAGAAADTRSLAGTRLTVEGPRGPVLRFEVGRGGVRLPALPGGTSVRLHRPQDLVPRQVIAVTLAVLGMIVAIGIWRRVGAHT